MRERISEFSGTKLQRDYIKSNNDSTREHTAAFIGPKPHRFHFKNNEQHPDCKQIKLALHEQISLLYKKGIRRFLTGVSIGVDMWAGEIVLDLMKQHKDIELYGIVPFEEQPIRWSETHRNRYYYLLSACTDVVQLSTRYYEGCYRARNKYLVENSKYLLAVYDKEEKMQGRTGQTVYMGINRGNSVICIHPQTRVILTETDLT